MWLVVAVQLLSCIWLFRCGLVFSGGSDGKESACNTGDPSSNPGLGRSPGEGHENPLHYSWWKIPWTEEPGGLYSSWGHKELDRTEQLSLSHLGSAKASALLNDNRRERARGANLISGLDAETLVHGWMHGELAPEATRPSKAMLSLVSSKKSANA